MQVDTDKNELVIKSTGEDQKLEVGAGVVIGGTVTGTNGEWHGIYTITIQQDAANEENPGVVVHIDYGTRTSGWPAVTEA